MTAVLEHAVIGRLAAGLPRTGRQVNALHESDAELLRLPGTDCLLAVTTDALAEELATGLYRDPWLIGWMLVTVNASDLAAVGAEPLGLLLCESLPADVAPAWLASLQRGIADAATATGLAVLGGDTNVAAVPHLAATAIGLVTGAPPLLRRGCRPGDGLYASGPLGSGAAYAMSRLRSRDDGLPFPFRPGARLREGLLLRGRATSCMDTSDGAVATLDELMTRSGVGFHVDVPVETWTDPRALAAVRSAGLPPWMLHAGPHGEFELLFTLPPARASELLEAAAAIGWTPLRLGVATAEPALVTAGGGGTVRLDSRRIRNLFSTCAGDVHRYVAALRDLVPNR